MRDNKLLKELMEMGGSCLGMAKVGKMGREMIRRGYEEEEVLDLENSIGGEDDMDDSPEGMDLEGEGEDEGPDAKKFVDQDEAAEHAKEFLARANEVLQYNKKEGGSEEVAKLAIQYAKDYYEAIVDEVNASKYVKDDEEVEPEMGM